MLLPSILRVRGSSHTSKEKKEVISPTLTIKVVGHQWFWSYELSDFITDSGTAIDFDSYMIPEDSLQIGDFRLLDVDNRLVVPADCHIRLIITSSDVLHSFAVPSLGVKLDACPGRLNQVSFLAERTGVFYGLHIGRNYSKPMVINHQIAGIP